MKILNIIMWILIIFFAIMVFWYIFGDSPTFEQTLLTSILILSITTFTKVGILGNRLGNLERSFYSLAKDFKEQVKHK